MARDTSPSTYAPPPTRARLRNKEYMFALFAGIFVLACYFYAREGSGTQALPSLPKEIKPPPVSDAVAAASPPVLPGTAEIDTTSLGHGSSSSSPSDSPGGGSSSSSDDAGGGVAVPSPSYLNTYSPKAVIIESSMIPNLIPLILHFATILGPGWGVILFTLQDRWIEPLSPAFQRLQASGHIEVRFLPADTELTNSHSVSAFLTSPWIWQQVELAKRVLLFQSDSILCAKSEAAVDDYFQYDFLGAPIAPVYGAGYNGGLSVRNPRMFLQIVRETDFAASGHEFEDQFFFAELKKRGAELPDEAVAKTFSVETIYYETPLGYHQPQRWQAANMESIEEWCPEVKMLIGRRAQ